MALAAKDIPITREDVYKWIQTWQKSTSKKKGSIEDYITKKVAKLQLPDEQIDTTTNDSLPDTMTATEMILADLESYGLLDRS